MGLKNIITIIINKFIKERENIIQAEKIVIDYEWEKLKKNIGKKYIWFVLTPANFDYYKTVYNINMEKEEFSQILKKRLIFLKQKREDIQLLIHLCKVKKFLDNEIQKYRFKEAMAFLNSIDIHPTKFIAIDGIYNNYTINLANTYGFKELTDFNIIIIKPLLKLINCFGIKLSFIHEIFKNFKNWNIKNIFYLFLGEFIKVKEKTIHVEALVRDDLWDHLKKEIIGKGYIWFIITPANYDYCKVFFNLKMNKEEFTCILKERIEMLHKNKENIQLHIHFAKDIASLDEKFQKHKFKEALDFLTSLNIEPNKFVAGWWIFNRNTIIIAKEFGFKEIYNYTINPLLRPTEYDGIKIKYVHKYWHDFDFI